MNGREKWGENLVYSGGQKQDQREHEYRQDRSYASEALPPK